jgi:hypothetical protein
MASHRRLAPAPNDWVPLILLPNVALIAPVETGIMALVPSNDARVRRLIRDHPRLKTFVGRFTDPFGQQVSPSIMVVRRDAPEYVRHVEAVASFRDLIALSVVPLSRARELAHPRGHRIAYSDAFSFYPWMIDRNYEHLVGSTPAFMGLHDIDRFKGQSSAEILPATLDPYDIDEPLLSELVRRWKRRYTQARVTWTDRALFRSLNMANEASRLPAAGDMTFYDVGRSLALWVSAFEILVHPGRGRSGLSQVYAVLDGIHWQKRKAARRRYIRYHPDPHQRLRRSLGAWIYGELYQARNDFLHGNPVSARRLIIRRSGRNLFQYAAPLYRMALASFLNLWWLKPIPSREDADSFGRYIAEKMNFDGYQETIEKGLLTLHVPAVP